MQFVTKAPLAASKFVTLAGLASVALLAQAAQAADLSMLYNFTTSGTMTLSRPSGGLTIDKDGNLFGTAAYNGSTELGGVYKLARQADGSYAAATRVVAFSTRASAPRSPGFSNPVTLDAAGNIYGALPAGAGGYGGVYSIAAGTSTVTTLARFVSGTAGGSTGINPLGALVMSADGTLWGTNADAGAGKGGTVYKVAPGSGVVTTVASFGADGLAGYGASSGLIADKQGNLYGATRNSSANPAGGGSGYGTLFKVDTSTGTVTTLATFAGGADGAIPFLSLAVDDAGNLFGTTTSGGANNLGTVFKLAAGESVITTLANFDRTTGGYAQGLIIDPVGNLFGTTLHGAPYAGYDIGGTVWKLAAGSSQFETFGLVAFGPSGAYSNGGLVADTQGNLYGLGLTGGSGGMIFKLSNAGYGIAPTVTPIAVAGVPEPATWGMMLLGFGMIGAASRNRRRSTATTFA